MLKTNTARQIGAGRPITGVCSIAEHEALKADLVSFRALAFVGAQTLELGDGAAISLEHRNCHCNSTLSRPCAADDVAWLNTPPATRAAIESPRTAELL